MRELKIIETTNGYILESEYNESETKVVKSYDVIEDINNDDRIDLARLLIKVAEHFGYKYEKYGKENINITFDKPGHKYVNINKEELL